MILYSQQGERLKAEDIARALGISTTTVSRALSGKGRVGEATRRRVLDYVRQMDCRISTAVTAGSTRNITLVIPTEFVRLDLPFMRKCMGGVCNMAAQRNCDVLLCYADEQDTRQLERQLEERKSDGVILTRTVDNDPCLELIRRHQIPFVTIGRPSDVNALQVDNENLEAAREMTQLLLRMGMGRIAYLGKALRNVVSRERLEGYLQSLADAGLQADPGLIRTELDDPDRRLDALDEVLTRKPDCILCGDDSMAVSVLKALRERGYQVPEDIRLASLYDSPALEDTVPSISAVSFDDAALGAAACRVLLDALAGRSQPTRQVLGHQVILRDSTK